MKEPLSRSKLADFLGCRRRFQLRYIERLAWPIPPLEGRGEEARGLGQRFHQILHRHFLGLVVGEEVNEDPRLRQWWERFKNQGPALPPGEQLPELTMTIPIGRHLLTGRFDLLLLGEEIAHVYDWKTDKQPRAQTELEADLQTRLYLALIAEGSQAMGRPIRPEQIFLTYWYVNEPTSSVTFRYSQPWHARNWTYLQELIADLEQQLASAGEWPLTEDLEQCARCAYQIYCNRIIDRLDLSEWETDEGQFRLEPSRP